MKKFMYFFGCLCLQLGTIWRPYLDFDWLSSEYVPCNRVFIGQLHYPMDFLCVLLVALFFFFSILYSLHNPECIFGIKSSWMLSSFAFQKMFTGYNVKIERYSILLYDIPYHSPKSFNFHLWKVIPNQRRGMLILFFKFHK